MPSEQVKGWQAKPVSDAQIARLWKVFFDGAQKRAGLTQDQFREYLKSTHGIESTKAIERGKYDEICSWLENFAQ